MTRLLIRDLALERWTSMDRYATSLSARLDDVLVPPEWQLHGPRFVTRYWRYPRALRRYRGDLVHVLDHSYAHCLAAFPGLPSVVTVHDLYPLRVLAEGTRGLRGRLRDLMLRRMLRWVGRADRLIVSTRYTARELERFLDIDPARIRVIPYGLDAHFFAPPPAEAVRERRDGWRRAMGVAGGPAHIVVHVGSCDPRKNVEAAITAIGLLRRRGVDAAFVQLGGRFGPSHEAAIAAAGVEGLVLQERGFSDASLVAAYAAADVLVMPSTFEGYGLPVVEAMAAGLPVVASGAGGLREVVGEAGLLTGAVDAPPLAEVLGRLLADPARRAELSALGRQRTAALTWDHVAAQTRAVYAELTAP